MRSGLELVRRSESSLARAPRGMGGPGVACCAVALSFALALLPLSSVLCVAGFVFSCGALATIPWRRGRTVTLPEDIDDPRLRETYTAILVAREQLDLAIASSPGCARSAASLQQRCTAAVRACGRVAPVANRLHAYLTSNEPWEIAREAAQLRTKAAAMNDEATARSLEQAATACERQLASCDGLARTRDRIQARLDLVLASLHAFTAKVVEQQTLEDEQLALAGDSISEHVDGVREELAALASALDIDAAA